jgi:putative ABC transport system permease protein
MNAFSVSYKNLKRKKVRSILTIAGVAAAVAVLVCLLGLDEGYQRSLTNDIDKMGYQILVTAKGCPYEAATLMLQGGGGLRYMEQNIYEKIKGDRRVDLITPQLVSSVFDPDRLEGKGGFTLFMGIDDSFLRLKPWVEFKQGGWFSGSDANEVIMGYEAAEVEQRLVGNEIFIPKYEKILKVVGIFKRTGTQDDGLFFTPLKTAQRIFDLPNKLTGVGVKLKDIQQLAAFEEDLYNEPGIQVISMAQVRGTILNLISSAKLMANSVAVVAILIATIGVVNTILMSVFERTQEIGVMKAMGASKTDVFKLILLETTLISAIGAVIGEIFALSGSSLIEAVLKKILPYAPLGQLVFIRPTLLLTALASAILIGMIAGLYPAWRACSMRPVEAIRRSQ